MTEVESSARRLVPGSRGDSRAFSQLIARVGDLGPSDAQVLAGVNLRIAELIRDLIMSVLPSGVMTASPFACIVTRKENTSPPVPRVEPHRTTYTRP